MPNPINKLYRTAEPEVVNSLLTYLADDTALFDRVEKHTIQTIQDLREKNQTGSYMARLLQKFQLNSPQGLTLMALAESLLRIPDAATANKLIQEKLTSGQWSDALDENDEALVKLSKFSLMASQAVLDEGEGSRLKKFVKKAVSTAGAPIIRQSIKQMIGKLADEFILGESIEKAAKRAKDLEEKGYCYSYDMLGEAAKTQADADVYFQRYVGAIEAMAMAAEGKSLHESPNISVKLSAIHPRYEDAQKERVVTELTPKVLQLAQMCAKANIGLTVDAEEADVLDMSLQIFENVFKDESLGTWDGFGLAVQAYQKRASAVIDWVIKLSSSQPRNLHVRLVKGAYWDTEIKRGQVGGLNDYPVFTHKFHTDLSYIACAKKLLRARDQLYPMFATHNAFTAHAIMELAGDKQGYEFQRLHGMGHDLYEILLGQNKRILPSCRIYAPVGDFNDLLPYLVRRMLENGANTSFVHHLTDTSIEARQLAKNPLTLSKLSQGQPHKAIPKPVNLHAPSRQNSSGADPSDEAQLHPLYEALQANQTHESAPNLGGKKIKTSDAQTVLNPAKHSDVVGTFYSAEAKDVTKAYELSHAAFENWTNTPADDRAKMLEKTADLMEQQWSNLGALCIREAGKSIPDAIDEIREAVDFCRYYAQRARIDFAEPETLHGPTGEHNQISLHGRGTFVCISPWNFPLAIFVGQIAAALAAGNCVLAKPAGPTQLIASACIDLLHEAGIPKDVLHLVPGPSSKISDALLTDPRLAGVAMTGSVATAHQINRTLAARPGPILPLIAETGGQNAMIVDSTALPEQVVTDVISSAFQSAGQRCSALRLLLIQDDIADKIIEMLTGAMAELKVGDPSELSTDVGPVIDQGAQTSLNEHKSHMQSLGTLIAETPAPQSLDGTFVLPAAYEIENLSALTDEQFGPVLHIMRYKAKNLDAVIDDVNALGFGLTLGIHSRIEKTSMHIFKRAHVGNTYVNRNMIGAVVGVQPFGGQGLSGTGPKAGGPRYLHRFAHERTLSIDTTAQGGDAKLMTLSDDL